MSVGTTPDIIQDDVIAPIARRMKNTPPDLLKLSAIPSSSFSQEIFWRNIAISAPTTVATRSAICEGPEVRSSPKRIEPTTMSITNTLTGMMASQPVIFFMIKFL